MKRILGGGLLLIFSGVLLIWGCILVFSGSSEKVLILISSVPVTVPSVFVGWSWISSGVLFFVISVFILLGRLPKKRRPNKAIYKRTKWKGLFH